MKTSELYRKQIQTPNVHLFAVRIRYEMLECIVNRGIKNIELSALSASHFNS